MIHLTNSDPKLAGLIKIIGDYSLNINEDYYLKLIQSIVGQQLSIKAKNTIWGRLELLCDNITPENISLIDDADLRGAGLSFAKISYIKGLSNQVIAGELDLNSFTSLSDDDIIKKLTAVKGIGIWTAEMFLIFSLGRHDVMSFDDVGLKRAIKWLYSLDNTPSPSEMKTISDSWKPYRSVASLYLWEIVNQVLIHQDVSTIIK